LARWRLHRSRVRAFARFGEVPTYRNSAARSAAGGTQGWREAPASCSLDVVDSF